MEKTYQNILNVILIVFLIATVILFYSQQKAINQLSSLLKNQDNAAQVEKNGGMKGATVDSIDRAKTTLETNTRFIMGRLVSVSGNDLTVEADMLDWEKMKETAVSGKSPSEKPSSTSVYKKTYTVTVNADTKFIANKLDSLKAGDTISVRSKELVYQTDKLTAVFVTSPNALPVS